jgi:hypothetical protein
MPDTQGRWTSKTPFPDLQLFIGAQRFKDLAGLATTPASIATPGLIFQTVPAGDASIFIADIPELLLRSGVLATPQYNQEQFGTAAAQPGPSSVSGTSGPLALPAPSSPFYQGFPPTPGAKMATVAGPNSGPGGKGIQIDSVDVIYQVLADATAVAATIGLTKTTFANLVAPVVTNLIALGNNGLPVVIGAQPQVKNVPVISPASMIVAADTEVLLNINLTGGTAGTIKFFGAVLKCHFNLM